MFYEHFPFHVLLPGDQRADHRHLREVIDAGYAIDTPVYVDGRGWMTVGDLRLVDQHASALVRR